jgi:hypothetical protein
VSPPAPGVDVLVVGLGPAGAALACRLRRAGLAVAAVTAPRRAAMEGLSTRALARLAEEGLATAAATAGAPAPRTGAWAGGRSVAGGEAIVDRTAFDAALLADCRAAGVTVYAARDGRLPAAARLCIDARGRRAPQARRGPALLAVAGRWSAVPGTPAGTSLHVLEDGWCWLASDGRTATLQLTTSARDPARRPPDERLAAARAALAGRGVRAALGGPLLGRPGARPAHARLGRALPWAVGDAAVALDPLSGQGVYEALSGARAVAAAALTALDGGDAALAERFVVERTATVWATTVDAAAGFYGQCAALGHFWAATAEAYRACRPSAPAPAAAAVARRPALVGDRIVEAAVVVTPSRPRGVLAVDGVPVVPLLEAWRVPPADPIATLAGRFRRPPAAVAAALGFLAAERLIPEFPHRVPTPASATGG